MTTNWPGVKSSTDFFGAGLVTIIGAELVGIRK